MPKPCILNSKPQRPKLHNPKHETNRTKSLQPANSKPLHDLAARRGLRLRDEMEEEGAIAQAPKTRLGYVEAFFDVGLFMESPPTSLVLPPRCPLD